MFHDVLQKFQFLPAEKKDYFSRPEILAKVKELEKKYQQPLSLLVMEIACQSDINKEAINKIIAEKGQKEELAADLWANIFSSFVAVAREKNLKQISLKEEEKEDISKTLPKENLLAEQKKQKIVFSSENFSKEKKEDASSEITVEEQKETVVDKGETKAAEDISKEKKDFIESSQPVNQLVKEKIEEESISREEAPEKKDDLLSEEENEELQKIVLTSKEGYSFALNWIKETERIFDSLHLSCSEEQRQKLIALLVSALRGARNTIALREVLSQSQFLAGLKLPSETVQEIVLAVKKAKEKLEQQKGDYKIKPNIQNLKDPFAFSDENVKVKKEENKETESNKQQEKKLLAPPVPTKFVWKKLLPLKIFSRKKNSSAKEVKEKQNIKQWKKKPIKENLFLKSEKKNLVSNFKEQKLPIDNNQVVNKQIIEKERGNKNEPFLSAMEGRKLVGPLDEIEQISLDDFRQWSKNPYQAAEHIKEKINNLYEESFSRGLEARERWRRSPLYKLYLDIVQEALIRQTSVQEVLKKQKEEKKETLTAQEFNALADLNKELRF